MFTGLVEKIGTVQQYEPRSAGARLMISCEENWDPSLSLGESIAVQGACLTVTEAGDKWFACDILAETLQKTTLSKVRTGQRLNLERALRVGDRLGGHILSGHIDGVGSLRAIRMEGADRVLCIQCSASLTDGIVSKGSVAIDGISLTVTAVSELEFEVKIIPWTWSHTSLSERISGDQMHVEIDMIGKYVKKYLSQDHASPLTEEKLRQAGY